MNDFHPWQSRPKRHRIDKGWIVAIAAIILLFAAMALAYDAESAMLPPRPGTEKILPAPVGRHERQLWCRYAPHVRPALRAECRQIGGYR